MIGGAAAATTQAQTQAPSNDALVIAAVNMPCVFNDERDRVLTKWNQLQVRGHCSNITIVRYMIVLHNNKALQTLKSGKL